MYLHHKKQIVKSISAECSICQFSPAAPVLRTVGGGQFCAICELVMKELDGILAQNATQAQIIAALDQVCNLLPSSLKQECDALVQQYTPLLIQLLTQISPKDICTKIGLCTSQKCKCRENS